MVTLRLVKLAQGIETNMNNDLQNMRHSAAHLLAAAVLRLWPDTKLTIGPAIENGFYYDFDFAQPINEDDLHKIEKMMAKTLPEWDSFSHREVTEAEAREYYKDNPYKLELIDEIVAKGEPITFYKAGYFEDLCRGGHSEHPNKDIGAYKLLSLAGAYWRGSEKNKMLTRVYATAFSTQEELDKHLEMLEEAKKRDHKKLGPQLDLFMWHETSPGMTYWLPKGLTLYNTLYDFAREMYKKHGYQEVMTPQLNKKELYMTSGHWQHYREDMFIAPMSFLRGETEEPLEGTETFGMKPMNCPNAMTIFKSRTRSYNDLPLRLAETSLLHRFELSGTLNGLFRTRQFRQDDAHVFITREQIKDEFERLMRMVEEMYAPFDLEYTLRFGTRPDEFLGKSEDWDVAEEALENVLKDTGKEYFKAEGEGAFYGPKVDILMKDILGREWQTGTIQLDFQQPQRFELKYATSDGGEQTPVVFHRAIYGSLERFLGVIIEHYAGAFPVWLAPVQVVVLPISEKVNDYAQKVYEIIDSSGVRVELDTSNETIGSKIRTATLQKVPFLCIIGEKEESEGKSVGKEIVSIRTREGKDLGQQELPDFLRSIQEKIEKKA
jgi:threonyl-tRNA synthetase